MDIDIAIKKIKENCEAEPYLPLVGKCDKCKRCEFFTNCMKAVPPYRWKVEKCDKDIDQAIETIRNHCINYNGNDECNEDCRFYPNCEKKAVPLFWIIEEIIETEVGEWFYYEG